MVLLLVKELYSVPLSRAYICMIRFNYMFKAAFLSIYSSNLSAVNSVLIKASVFEDDRLLGYCAA